MNCKKRLIIKKLIAFAFAAILLISSVGVPAKTVKADYTLMEIVLPEDISYGEVTLESFTFKSDGVDVCFDWALSYTRQEGRDVCWANSSNISHIDDADVSVIYKFHTHKYKEVQGKSGFDVEKIDGNSFKVTATLSAWKAKSAANESPVDIIGNDTYTIEMQCEDMDSHSYTNAPYGAFKVDSDGWVKTQIEHGPADSNGKVDKIVCYKPWGDEEKFTIEKTSDNYLADDVAYYKVIGSKGEIQPVNGKYTITKDDVTSGKIKIFPIFKAPEKFDLTDAEKANLWFGPNQSKVLTYKVSKSGQYRYNIRKYTDPEDTSSTFAEDYKNSFNIEVKKTDDSGTQCDQIVRVYTYHRYINEFEHFSQADSVTVKYDATAPYMDGAQNAYLVLPNGNGGENEVKISELTTTNPIYVSETSKDDVKIRLYVKDDDSGITNQSIYDTDWTVIKAGESTYVEQPFTEAMISGRSFTFYDDVKNADTYTLSDLTGKYIVDKTAPTATLTYSVDGENDNAFTGTAPTTWKNVQVKIKVSPSDTESGVAKVTYTKNAGTETELVKNSSDEYILECEEGSNTYNFYVYDNVGNKSTVDYEVTVKQETAGITDAEITFSSGTEWNLEPFNIKVSSKTFAGFESVQYNFYEEGNATPVKTVTHTVTEDNILEDTLVYPLELGNFQGKVVITIIDKAGNTKDVEKSLAYNKDVTDSKDFDNYVENIKNASTGELEIPMSGITTVPATIFEAAKGKDIALVFEMDNGIKWTVNGKDITGTDLKDINLAVTKGKDAGKTIPVDVINEVTGEQSSINLSLAYDGQFGFKAVLTVNLEAKNKDLIANLFYYNPSTKELEYMCAAKIDATGNADLTFTHASDYVIVISDKDMKDALNKAPEPTVTPNNDAPTTEPKTGDSFDARVWFLLVLSCMGLVALRLKKREN